jgi:hypothetical protein
MNGYRNLAAAAIAALMAVGIAMPAGAQSELKRLVAERNFFGTEAVTALEPPGIAIYSKTILVPAGNNVLYLTMSTTGDTHDGAASCFTARVDGNFFAPGQQGSARCANGGTTRVPGWITLLKLPLDDNAADNCNDGGGGSADCHDNSIHYEWCKSIAPGVHTVEVRMATSSAGSNVFIEQAHFYVDTNGLPSGARCVRAATPTALAEPSTIPNN